MKKYGISVIMALFVSLLLLMPVQAENSRVVDGADLLTEEQEIDLLEQLNEISERQKADVVVVTQEDIGIRTPMQFADDFFDYNGYGMGPDRDGILLLISMANRSWWISTSGFCVEAFTDAGIEYIGEEINIYLSEAEYDNAFAIYAEQCDLFLTQAKEGEPFDEGNMPKRKVDPLHIPICLVVGFLISFVLASRKKAALKSVRANDTAREYAVPGSMTLTIQRDQYLNKTVTTRIIQKKSSSGGSSTHTSSSGRSHGGGGGKF